MRAHMRQNDHSSKPSSNSRMLALTGVCLAVGAAVSVLVLVKLDPVQSWPGCLMARLVIGHFDLRQFTFFGLSTGCLHQAKPPADRTNRPERGNRRRIRRKVFFFRSNPGVVACWLFWLADHVFR